MPPGTTGSPTSKDTTIVSGSIPPSGKSPPNRQSAKPLNPVSAKSEEGHSCSNRARCRQAHDHHGLETIGLIEIVGNRRSEADLNGAAKSDPSGWFKQLQRGTSNAQFA